MLGWGWLTSHNQCQSMPGPTEEKVTGQDAVEQLAEAAKGLPFLS